MANGAGGAQAPESPNRQVEIVRLDFKGTEVDNYHEFLGYMDPFVRRLMNSTTLQSSLAAHAPRFEGDDADPGNWKSSPAADMVAASEALEDYAAKLSKTSKAMAEQATERAQATVHGGENLFAKMLLAACAYFMEFKGWPHPAAEWKIQGHVFKAVPEDWNSIRRWTQALFVLAGVR